MNDNKLIVLKNNFIQNYFILNELNSIRVLKYIFYYSSEVLFIIYYLLVANLGKTIF